MSEPGTVALVLVGDELLLGDVVDANGPWLARRFRGAGMRVASTRIVRDDEDGIAGAVEEATGDAPVVVVTGGLGPTSDDRTRDALALVTGSPLRTDPEALADLHRYADGRGRPLDPAEEAMALTMDGAARIPNPVGSAPGLEVDLGIARAYVLPGVPSEVRAMVEATVLPAVLAASGRLPAVRRCSLRVAGPRETAVASRLAALEARLGADPGAGIAYLPGGSELEVRLTVVRDDDADDAEAALGAYVRTALAALGPDCYGRDGDTLASVLLAALGERGATCATAESLTGGGVGAALTAVEGSSTAYRGGVVAYATDLKAALLGVPAEHLAARGAVDPDTALLMAAGVAERLGATYGLSTTGVAGPVPHEDQPPGTVHVAVAGPGVREVRSARFGGDRDAVRRQSVVAVLDLARRVLLEGGHPRGSGAES